MNRRTINGCGDPLVERFQDVSTASCKGTVLVVDDVPFHADELSHILGEDFAVKVALDGATALQLIHQDGPPDLILLDVIMPEMDGYEVCRVLKASKATKAIPIIFVTARGEIQDERTGLALGAVDYITKPFDPAVVLARARTHVELKKSRDALESQNEILREYIRLREDVDQISKHDLKDPLMIILNAPALLPGDADRHPGYQEVFQLMREAGYRMLEMINRSVDLYKMERGIYVLRPESVDLLAIIGRIAMTYKELMAGKRVALEILTNGTPATSCDSFLVEGEELLLHSMLANLVRNAIEASPPDGKVTIALQECGDSFAISVHNLGAIPSAVRDRFFQKFSTHGKYKGVGLGAYTAKLVAVTHGGSIGFESSESSGTTITVRLPAGRATGRSITDGPFLAGVGGVPWKAGLSPLHELRSM